MSHEYPDSFFPQFQSFSEGGGAPISALWTKGGISTTDFAFILIFAANRASDGDSSSQEIAEKARNDLRAIQSPSSGED